MHGPTYNKFRNFALATTFGQRLKVESNTSSPTTGCFSLIGKSKGRRKSTVSSPEINPACVSGEAASSVPPRPAPSATDTSSSVKAVKRKQGHKSFFRVFAKLGRKIRKVFKKRGSEDAIQELNDAKEESMPELSGHECSQDAKTKQNNDSSFTELGTDQGENHVRIESNRIESGSYSLTWTGTITLHWTTPSVKREAQQSCDVGT